MNKTIKGVLEGLQYQACEEGSMNPARIVQAETMIKKLISEKIDQTDLSSQITWLKVEVYSSSVADYTKTLLELFESGMSEEMRSFLTQTYINSREEAEKAATKLKESD